MTVSSQVYHLWDALLLRGEAFPLCVGVAILCQLREQLLTFGFNECILTFTDMPELDIERLVKDAVDIFDATPPSICFRFVIGTRLFFTCLLIKLLALVTQSQITQVFAARTSYKRYCKRDQVSQEV